MQHQRDDTDPELLIVRATEAMNDPGAEESVAELEQLIDGGVDRVIVDCTGLGYLNSFALSVLMRLRNRLRPRGGAIRLCGTTAQIDKLLELTSLSPHLPRSATLEEARAALGS